MDIDTLAQKLAAHATFIERLQHGEQSELAKFNPADSPPAPGNKMPLNRLFEADQEIIPEVRQMMALLEAIMQNSVTGLAVVSGPELTIHLANPAYLACVPYPGTQVTGARLREVWPAALGVDFEQLVRQVLAQGANQHVQRLEMRFPDGLNHSFSLQMCPLPWQDQEGALILMLETTQADRARQLAMEVAEETFHQARELDAILSSMVDAVILLNRRGRVMRANPSAVELLGLDPVGLELAELVSTLSARYLDGSPVEAGDFPFERAFAGKIITGEHLLIENENGELVVRVSASPLFNEIGVSQVITVWHDVTERERLLEQLEIEQSRLETIIKNAPEAIVVADEEGRIVLGNPAAEAVFGQALPYGQDFTSQVGLEIRYHNGAPYDPRNLPLTCSALDGERLNDIEMQVVFPGGAVRHVVASTAPIVDRRGNLNGAVGIFQDITRRKQEEAALREQANRSQLLARLSQQFAEAGHNWNDLLNTITDQVGRAMGHLCSLHLFTDDIQEQYLAAIHLDNAQSLAFINHNIRGVRFPTSQGLAESVLRAGQPILQNDMPGANIFDSIPGVNWPAAGFRVPRRASVLLVPLRAHGRWVGMLNLMRFQPGMPFQEEDKIFMQDLAERAALAIENARLYEEEARRAREMEALHQAAGALLSTLDLEMLLGEILKAAHLAIPAAQYGMVFLISEETGQLDARATHGRLNTGENCGDMQSLAAEAVRARRSVLRPVPDCKLPIEAKAGHGLHSMVAAPLMQPNKVFGALVLYSLETGQFTPNDLNLLNSFAATATAALQNATLYAEVQRLATTDTLTEQFNRRRFLELSELEIFRSRRFSTPLSAIMFDLDNFKDINDSHGHAAGDYVLHTVAQRCQASIRVIDILGRYGGDEFAILLPNAGMEEAQEIAERIRQSVTANPICTGRADINLTISLGVAQVEHANETLASLLGRADSALYSAKQQGRNQVARA